MFTLQIVRVAGPAFDALGIDSALGCPSNLPLKTLINQTLFTGVTVSIDLNSLKDLQSDLIDTIHN
jgi:hypothetical protein